VYFTSNEYKNVIVDKLTYDQKSKEWARIANPRQRATFRSVADGLQSIQDRSFSTENRQSQMAQKLGYFIGRQKCRTCR